MNYIGLDLSLTASGVFIIDDNTNTILQTCLGVPQQGIERLFFLRSKFNEILDTHPITFACLESGAYNEKGRLFQIGELYGLVTLLLYEKGIPYISAAPLAVKKYVSSIGKNQGKGAVMLDVFKMYGLSIYNDNEADACVLSHIAKDYYSTVIQEHVLEDLKPYQKEVLKTIAKSTSVQKNCII